MSEIDTPEKSPPTESQKIHSRLNHTPGSSLEGKRWMARIVVLAALMIALGPILYSLSRREVAKWYHAAGYESLLENDLEQALAHIDKSLKWDPGNVDLLMERANWTLRTGNAIASLDDCDEALARARVAYGNEAKEHTLIRLVGALNLRAYAHALANRKLDEALANIQEAFEILGHTSNSAFLDTRGYIYYRQGETQKSFKDMERAVSLAEGSYKMERADLRQHARLMVDRRPAEYQERSLREGLAVLYHHRGLAYEKLGRTEEAAKDFAHAKELGYDPESGVW